MTTIKAWGWKNTKTGVSSLEFNDYVVLYKDRNQVCLDKHDTPILATITIHDEAEEKPLQAIINPMPTEAEMLRHRRIEWARILAPMFVGSDVDPFLSVRIADLNEAINQMIKWEDGQG